ncbi:MAG: hypothetical protein QXT73_02980 [Candidatus Methanomethylicaceae archaeon]
MMLEAGVYLNLFPLEIQASSITLMVASRKCFSDLRPLKSQIQEQKWDISLFAEGETVYGYGGDQERLQTEGFSVTNQTFFEHPVLACRMIGEGLLRHLKAKGYITNQPPRKRIQVFEKQPQSLCHGKVHLYQGWALRPFYWHDPVTQRICFGVIVDVCWKLCDSSNNAAVSTRDMMMRFGNDAMMEVAQAQGEYLPGTRSVNYQIARQQLRDKILPFVKSIGRFELIQEVTVQLSEQPVSITLGGEEDE